MIDEKPWWQSRTIWASLVAVIAVVLGYFGYDIGGEDQAGLVEAISSGVAIVGSLIAIITRIGATKTISTPSKP